MKLARRKRSRSKEREEFVKQYRKDIIKRSFGLFIFIMICSGFKAGIVMSIIVSLLTAGFLLFTDKIFDLLVMGFRALYIRYFKEWFDGLRRAKAKIQE